MNSTTKQLSNRVLIASLAFLAVLPLWIPEFPVGIDLPQHAAQIALFAALHSPGFPWPGLFRINWFTPYLLGYFLVYALTPLMGIIAALKCVISASLILFVLATAKLIAELDGDDRLALLVIPTLYGGVFLFGFLNFLVAAPIGLYFLVCFVRWLKAPTIGWEVAIGALLVLLFFAHLLICAFFGLIAVLWIWPYRRNMRAALAACRPLLPVFPLVLFWLWHNRSVPQFAHSLILFESLGQRVDFLRIFMLGWHSRLSDLVVMVLCLWPLMAYRLRRDFRHWTPLVCALLIVLFGPFKIMGAFYVSVRFAIFFFPMYAIIFEPKAEESWSIKAGTAALVLVILVWAGTETWRMVSFRKESQGFSRVLEQMQPSQLCLSFPINRDSAFFPWEAYLHFPAWYGGVKHGVVSPGFSEFYNELIVYNRDVPNNLAIPPLWQFNSENLVSPQIVRHFRYLLVESVAENPSLWNGIEPRPIFRVHKGRWWLYENSIPNPAANTERVYGAAGHAY